MKPRQKTQRKRGQGGLIVMKPNRHTFHRMLVKLRSFNPPRQHLRRGRRLEFVPRGSNRPRPIPGHRSQAFAHELSLSALLAVPGGGRHIELAMRPNSISKYRFSAQPKQPTSHWHATPPTAWATSKTN